MKQGLACRASGDLQCPPDHSSAVAVLTINDKVQAELLIDVVHIEDRPQLAAEIGSNEKGLAFVPERQLPAPWWCERQIFTVVLSLMSRVVPQV